jgi:hypothetical protein
MAVEDLLRLVACVEGGAAVAVGTRFAPGGGIKGDDGTGALRALFALGRSRDAVLPVVLSWALNTIVVPAILRDGVHDYTSGFIVGRRSILGALELRGRHGEYFVDLFARMRSLGHDVAEVPYRARPRTRGRSKTVARPSDYLVRGRAYLGAAWSARSVR